MVHEHDKRASPWPDPPGAPVLFILDAAHDIETDLLKEWLHSTAAEPEADANAAKIVLPILYGRKGRLEVGDLPAKLGMDGQAIVVPVRVVWLPSQSAKQSAPRFRDLFLGNPKHPRRFAAKLILRREPHRAKCVAGASATISDLRQRYEELQSSDEARETASDFAAFVVRQAGVALDIAERRLHGNRYKVPHYVADSIASSRKFRDAIKELAAESGKPVAKLHEEARGYMKEMIAQPNSFFIDWMGKITRLLVSLGYDKQVVCNEDDIERTRNIMREHPTALLWSHKSHVDGMAVMSVTYDNDLPAAHSLGGINMAFSGMGALGRRSGVIYIRRTFADNPVYKLVFRHYLGYLMEKRFPLSWAFEGTRSRVGKLMPPRYGLIKYAIEAAHATGATDLHFIPVAISYDLIGEAGEYAKEQSGKEKRPESLSWFVGYVRKLRAPKGRVYLDFCDPVVIEGTTPAPEDVDMSKLAFEIAVNVNEKTPVTFPSLACIALLGAAPRALTFDEFRIAVRDLVLWLRKRKIRLTDSFDKGRDEQLAELARITIDRGVISEYTEGPESVYGIKEERYAVAGYYRNTVVHYFVNKAIIELAWVGVTDKSAAKRLDAFWAETDRLRDVFKFEFFYSPKEEFRAQIEAELALYDNDWQSILEGNKRRAETFLSEMRPLVAHATLLPYVEAYGIVAQVLDRLEAGAGINEKDSVEASLKLGQQRYLQRQISSNASIAKLLFSNGHKLFSNLGLTASGDPAVSKKRAAAVAEFAQLSERLSRIQLLARLQLED